MRHAESLFFADNVRYFLHIWFGVYAWEVGASRGSETSDARKMEPTGEAGVGLVSGTLPGLGPVVQIDEGRIQAHLDEVVR
jgi:hypothetical protein